MTVTPTATRQPIRHATATKSHRDGKSNAQTLRNSVAQAMHNYFAHLDGQAVTDVYHMVLAEVEAPLLETVMAHVHGNQTKAAALLGLNRGTLRKKLTQYDLL